MAVVRDMLKKKGCSIKLVMLGNSTADEEGLAQFFKPSLLKAVHLQCTVPHVTEQYLEVCVSFVKVLQALRAHEALSCSMPGSILFVPVRPRMPWSVLLLHPKERRMALRGWCAINCLLGRASVSAL